MNVTDDDVVRWAQLAKIDVPTDEIGALRRDLEAVLAHLATVRAVDVDGLEPLLRPSDVDDPLRDDVIHPGMARETTLGLGRGHHDGFLRVPRTSVDGSGSA